MYEVYDKWDKIALEQFNSDIKPMNPIKTTHIVFAGMGGSGALSDFFASILSKTNIHVEVVKGYLLPKTVDSESLVIATSISGNTEETLNVLVLAKKIGCRVIAFTDGGKMLQYCIENNLEYRKIDMQHSPRASFISYLFSMLKVLQNTIPIQNDEIKQSIEELAKLQKIISSSNLSKTNPALTLAQWISEIPIIYYPWGLQAAAIRFKNSLQENAKIHVMTEDVIEACHNGIVSWEKSSNIKPILIQGEDDFVKTKERWKILNNFFKEKNIECKEVISIKGNILSKLINLIYLLDYTSIYKAILDGVDPTSVEPIDYVKNKL